MSKIILPVVINPPSIRKDGSASIKFDTRELSGEEYMMILGYRNTEGWLLYSPNEITAKDIEELPKDAELDNVSKSKRQKSVLFLLWKQATEKGKYTGSFDTYYSEKMEQIIQKLKDQIDD